MALDLSDKTSNGNTLTNSGATDVTSSLPFASSLHAAGLTAASSQFLYAADSSSLSVTGNFTFQMWVKFNSTPASGFTYRLLSKVGDGSAGKWSYDFTLFNNAGTLEFDCRISSDGQLGATRDHIVQAWTPSTGTWYNIAWVFTAASAKHQFFVNGSQQGTDQTLTQTSIFNNTTPLGIGVFDPTGTPAAFFDGVIDDIRIFNIARTGAQLTADYQQNLSGSENGLVAYWPFESVAGGSFIFSLL